jgi:hypothetical protein
MNTTKKIVVHIIGIIIILYVGMSLGARFSPKQSPDANFGGALQTVNVLIDRGDDRVQFGDSPALSNGTGVTALAALTSVLDKNSTTITTKDYGDMGILVQKIGDLPKTGDSRYWQYWVNGVYGKLSASKYQLHTGDTVLWKLAKDSTTSE